jgi:hypothetical protein
MVKRMRLNVTLYVLCLSCFITVTLVWNCVLHFLTLQFFDVQIRILQTFVCSVSDVRANIDFLSGEHQKQILCVGMLI